MALDLGTDLPNSYIGSSDIVTVLNNTERDAIPKHQRHWGMFVYVTGTTSSPVNTYYQLKFNLVDDVISNNSNWTIFTPGISDGDKGDITVSGTGATFTVNSGVLGLTAFVNQNPFSVLGTTSTNSGPVGLITATSDYQVLLRDSTGLTFSQIGTTSILDNSIDNLKLSDMDGLSVKGNPTNTTGNPSNIIASTDGYALRRSGTTLGFGEIVTSGIANDAITNSKLYNMPQNTFKGRITTGTGDPEDLTVSQVHNILGTLPNYTAEPSFTTSGTTTLTKTSGKTVDFRTLSGTNSSTTLYTRDIVLSTSSINSGDQLTIRLSIQNNIAINIWNGSTAGTLLDSFFYSVTGGTSASTQIIDYRFVCSVANTTWTLFDKTFVSGSQFHYIGNYLNNIPQFQEITEIEDSSHSAHRSEVNGLVGWNPIQIWSSFASTTINTGTTASVFNSDINTYFSGSGYVPNGSTAFFPNGGLKTGQTLEFTGDLQWTASGNLGSLHFYWGATSILNLGPFASITNKLYSWKIESNVYKVDSTDGQLFCKFSLNDYGVGPVGATYSLITGLNTIGGTVDVRASAPTNMTVRNSQIKIWA